MCKKKERQLKVSICLQSAFLVNQKAQGSIPSSTKGGTEAQTYMIPGLRVKTEAPSVQGLQDKFQVNLGHEILSQRMGVASEGNCLFGASAGVYTLPLLPLTSDMTWVRRRTVKDCMSKG